MYEVMNEEGGKMGMSVGNWHMIKDSNWGLIIIRQATINVEQLETSRRVSERMITNNNYNQKGSFPATCQFRAATASV